MSLSTNLLLRVTLPVLGLLVGLVVLLDLEMRDRVLVEARQALGRSAADAAEIVDRDLVDVGAGLEEIATSQDLRRWALADDASDGDAARLSVERAARQLVDRIPELRLVSIMDDDGLGVLEVGDDEDIPWDLRRPSPAADESSTLWKTPRWALVARTVDVGSGTLHIQASLDLQQLVVDAMGFTSRHHPGACLVLSTADNARALNAGPTCRHTDDRVAAQQELPRLGAVLALHDSPDMLLTGVRDIGFQAIQLGLLVVVAIGLITWLGLRATVVSPLQHILNVVEAFDRGQRTPPRTSQRSDELGLLETSMRNALDGLTAGHQKLTQLNDTLEARVTDRTKQLGQYAEELRAARDEAQTASTSRAEFVTRMSHALRTPLNGIIGMTGLLQDTELTEEQQEFVETVSRSGNALRALLDDVIQFSHLDRNQVELEEQDFRLRNVLRDVRADVLARAKRKGLLVELEIHPDLPQVVRADLGRIRQVLNHLTQNAVTFTTHGEIILRARPVETPDSGMQLMFEVQDTGDGIGPEARKTLFTPFQRADGRVGRDSGGLGLSLCSLLAQAMAGEIGVNSQVGRGSTFWFTARCLTVGRALPEGTRTHAASETSLEEPLHGHGQRILVVEDDLINQRVAARMLEKLGYAVDVAANGREALHAHQRDRYAAILMDCEMPIMDGFEATAAIRERSPAGEPTPIIAMTAHAMDGDRERVLAAGMDDYLSKPVSRDDLARMLQRWIPAGEVDTTLEAT